MSAPVGQLQPWKPNQPISATRLENWQSRTITTITVEQNTPLTCFRQGNNVVIGYREPPRSLAVCWVKVTGNATGGGKYVGRIMKLGDTTPSLSSDLAEIDFGEVGTEDNCYILNAAEVGQSTHDLTDGTPVTKMFPGVYTGHMHTDGLPFIRISGYDWKACDEEE